MILLEGKRMGVKIRIEGPDKSGKNTTRMLTISDANVDEVTTVLRNAILAKSYEEVLERKGIERPIARRKRNGE